MSFFLFRIFTTTDFLFFTHVYIQMIVKGLQLTEACDSKCGLLQLAIKHERKLQDMW